MPGRVFAGSRARKFALGSEVVLEQDNWSMVTLLRNIFLVVMLALAGCNRPDYDKDAYDEMEQVIDGSTAKLIGLPLDEAIRTLSLEGVKWDEGYSSAPLRQLRVYHYKGFYLLLGLRMLPPGMGGTTPKNPKAGASPNAGWFVSDFYPALHIDNIKDPAKRMEGYWKGIRVGMRMNGQAPNQVIPETPKPH